MGGTARCRVIFKSASAYHANIVKIFSRLFISEIYVSAVTSVSVGMEKCNILIILFSRYKLFISCLSIGNWNVADPTISTYIFDTVPIIREM